MRERSRSDAWIWLVRCTNRVQQAGQRDGDQADDDLASGKRLDPLAVAMLPEQHRAGDDAVAVSRVVRSSCEVAAASSSRSS